MGRAINFKENKQNLKFCYHHHKCLLWILTFCFTHCSWKIFRYLEKILQCYNGAVIISVSFMQVHKQYSFFHIHTVQAAPTHALVKFLSQWIFGEILQQCSSHYVWRLMQYPHFCHTIPCMPPGHTAQTMRCLDPFHGWFDRTWHWDVSAPTLALYEMVFILSLFL